MVVKGIGIDLIEVERIRRAINRRPASGAGSYPGRMGVLPRGGKVDYAALAARFAAKEAVLRPWGAAGARSWRK